MNNDLNDIFDKKQLEGNPFKVPNGYFETLNSRIMENVAQYEKLHGKKETIKAKHISMRPFRWAAACACVLVVATSAFIFSNKYNESQDVVATTQQYAAVSDDAFNQAADYTMLDNHDMYQMLAEE